MKEEWIDYYVYLEELRRSGRTNMWGARDYLVIELRLDTTLAGEVLANWMKNYQEIEKYLEENNLVTPRKD